MSTLRAILTRIRGIHGYVLSTGACSLVRKEVRELAPRRVMDALSKTMVMHHPIDRQVFNGNEIKRVRDTAAVLMSKVTPSPALRSYTRATTVRRFARSGVPFSAC